MHFFYLRLLLLLLLALIKYWQYVMYTSIINFFSNFFSVIFNSFNFLKPFFDRDAHQYSRFTRDPMNWIKLDQKLQIGSDWIRLRFLFLYFMSGQLRVLEQLSLLLFSLFSLLFYSCTGLTYKSSYLWYYSICLPI